MSDLRTAVAQAICEAYGDEWDQQPASILELREWRKAQGIIDKNGDGIIRAYDPGLPTQSDWLDCADAAIAVMKQYDQG